MKKYMEARVRILFSVCFCVCMKLTLVHFNSLRLHQASPRWTWTRLQLVRVAGDKAIRRNTDKRRQHEILGPDDYFPATGDDRNQKSNQGCLNDVSQVQAVKRRLRLLDAVITPTICHAAGTCTPTQEHERMIQSTQRRMLVK